MYGAKTVEEDLSWFLVNKVLTPEEGKELTQRIRDLVKEIAPYSMQLVDAFGKYALYAPIAGDWAEFNKDDNQGELLKSKL